MQMEQRVAASPAVLSEQPKQNRARLSSKERQALEEYRQFLVTRFPGQVERLILFGSKARGDARPESEIDVLVVLATDGGPPPGLTNPTWREIVAVTFDLLMKHGVYISPTVVNQAQFSRWSPLMAHIREEGIERWSQIRLESIHP